MIENVSLLTRHASNPVLEGKDCPFPATLVFNAGVAYHEGRYVMVFRNDHGRWGDPQFDGTNLGLATSSDGLSWEVEPEPILDEERARAGLRDLYPERFGPEFVKRIYDPRITIVEGRAYLCFAVDTDHGVCGGVAETDDFRSFRFLSLSAPDNRNFVLFPERVGGEFVRLERPFPSYMQPRPERFPIWTSRSKDMRAWGAHRPVLGPEDLPYGNCKLGPAAPPIKTDRGWLTTIHVVNKDPASPLAGWEAKDWTKTYVAGLVLLDLEDPSKVVGMMREPLLAPEAPYELDGFRGSVIFPCGMVAQPDGEVRMYYGAADTCIAMASAHIDDLIAACRPMA